MARYHHGSFNKAKRIAKLKIYRKESKPRPKESSVVNLVKIALEYIKTNDELDKLRRKTKFDYRPGKYAEIHELSKKLFDTAKQLCSELEINVYFTENYIPEEDLWKEAHQVLKRYPYYFLCIQDGWAEKTFYKTRDKIRATSSKK